jgi:hypothetical protein
MVQIRIFDDSNLFRGHSDDTRRTVEICRMLAGRLRHQTVVNVLEEECQVPNRKAAKYWSGDVTKRSDALDLEQGVFTWTDPKRIARSLRDSAEKSTRRKGSPFQSAMSMLNFYINRGGRNLDARHKKVLSDAKDELRKLFSKDS